MMDVKTKKDIIVRLRRIQGQVGGVERMVEEDKYCIDLLLQISAIRGALEGVSLIVMKSHFETCVSDAIQSGSTLERARKIEEIMEVFSRFGGIHIEKQNILANVGPRSRCSD